MHALVIAKCLIAKTGSKKASMLC